MRFCTVATQIIHSLELGCPDLSTRTCSAPVMEEGCLSDLVEVAGRKQRAIEMSSLRLLDLLSISLPSGWVRPGRGEVRLSLAPTLSVLFICSSFFLLQGVSPGYLSLRLRGEGTAQGFHHRLTLIFAYIMAGFQVEDSFDLLSLLQLPAESRDHRPFHQAWLIWCWGSNLGSCVY